MKASKVDTKDMRSIPIDLDEAFKDATWDEQQRILTYELFDLSGKSKERIDVEVFLESAEAFNATAFRWSAKVEGVPVDSGAITLDMANAIDGGHKHAKEFPGTPHATETYWGIVSQQ